MFLSVLGACANRQEMFSSAGESWGIYEMNLKTGGIQTIYAGEDELSGLSFDPAGEKLVFSQITGGSGYEYSEIYTLDLTEGDLNRLTDNQFWDIYPVWSPAGDEIAFLSWRESTLDIYKMDSDGANQVLLYDSGYHDADIDWVGDRIVFTSQSRIWIMGSDGNNPGQLTDPPRAGEWGQANLPFGDYDPRLNPADDQVVFSRLVRDESVHGNYDLFLLDLDSTDLVNLTKTGYSQGLSSWSSNGERILYVLSAIGEEGLYDLYSIRRDGTDNQLLNPASLPPNLLIHGARFGLDDDAVYFIGQWWPGSE